MQMDTIAGGSSEPDLNGAKLGGSVDIETLYAGGIEPDLYGGGSLDAIF